MINQAKYVIISNAVSIISYYDIYHLEVLVKH